MMEYRDVFVTLLKNFKESQCSRWANLFLDFNSQIVASVIFVT